MGEEDEGGGGGRWRSGVAKEGRGRGIPVSEVVSPPYTNSLCWNGSGIRCIIWTSAVTQYMTSLYDITHYNDVTMNIYNFYVKSTKRNMKNRYKCYNTVINEFDYSFGAQYIAVCRFSLSMDLFFLGAMMPSSTT